jgi:hypothetical protein
MEKCDSNVYIGCMFDLAQGYTDLALAPAYWPRELCVYFSAELNLQDFDFESQFLIGGVSQEAMSETTMAVYLRMCCMFRAVVMARHRVKLY